MNRAITGERPVEATGLYLHVPFCASRCSYCTFVVTTDRRWIKPYFEALEAELTLGSVPESAPIATLYIGGGTPSQAPAPLLTGLMARLLEDHPLVQGAEVTAEANPEDVTEELLDNWAQLGINRLSLGIQSFIPGELEVLERRHDAHGARRAAEAVLSDGRFNLNLDLMAAIPGQTTASLDETLGQILELRPHHVSVYLLEMDKPHRLRRLHARQPGRFPDQDAAAEAYLAVHKRLTGAGYSHYEVSNFALPGRTAAHNLRYWHRLPVHALGVAAHGQDGNLRWANLDTIRGYLSAVDGGTRPLAWESELSPLEALAEAVMLGLRLEEGVSENRVGEAAAALPTFAARLADFEELGLARRADGRLRLTPRGWLVSNELFAELV